jgi:hypothetical protein
MRAPFVLRSVRAAVALQEVLSKPPLTLFALVRFIALQISSGDEGRTGFCN